MSFGQEWWTCQRCGACTRTGDSHQCWQSWPGQAWWWAMPLVSPPAVCTGTGTVAVDLLPMATEGAAEGECGICGQRVRLSDGQHLVTHPYTPKSRGEARDAR